MNRALNFTSSGGITIEPTYVFNSTAVGTSLRSISVTMSDLISGTVIPAIASHMQTSYGVYVLLDKVVINLLNTLGSSLFDSSFGSIIHSLNFQSNADRLVLMAQVTTALKTVEQNIINNQATLQNISSEQTLQKLVLQNIYADPVDPTAIRMSILVITAANSSYLLTV